MIRRWLKSAAILSVMGMSGCASYTAAQMQLVEQARRGVALAMRSQAEHGQAFQHLQQNQRQRLDDAFDADVVNQTQLSANWVIEHRKAYAVGLDALAKEREASIAADAIAQANLRATDEALKRLAWLQAIQLQWAIPDRQISADQTTEMGSEP